MSTSSVPSLTYFQGRGLGQFSRVLLSYLGIPYENITVTEISDALRATLPYGQLPIYRDGDFVLTQSSTIARYIAKKHNFMGKNLEEEFLVDQIVTAIHADIFPAFNNPVPEKLQKLYEKYFGSFEKKLQETGFLVGSSVTLADLYVYVGFDYIRFRGEAALSSELSDEKYPKIAELKKFFESNEGVAKYIKERPETKF
ncbi:hypothetical protein DDB_G0272632 [Dictyostelium discoideum AX4]|uniref:Putative glutathione S-transferase alpha-2 n=1 Tax=Dictyostelium discoideum TaxID=44689 RepID=GSTA2_DICDI|nr:hypothetical protein DDB_G0274081 [Dictyostelium discoideum AX4]XP_645014.1 hypothetical protein DDB_G0272632 [Dictyostelium discoideum AX4]Q556G3.1 RecName: Full=Putative glutathione S-transferase alpha-2; AltName: Full=GST class-alpha 2 [Dictyostelium discoideum]EAL70474.1 hypothetical protein DDB_G0274081 [Dictyostelium discoideum AX4]EAL70953.1 hypothetical protein DDB_G0272632 [Dictyostelium discoideum AX4]|eukprot:XP_644399.1 hypothetical protein DDB_G0274081 [Dictyostelium discoideum AX4]